MRKGECEERECQEKVSALTNVKGTVIIIIYYEIRILAETKKTGFFIKSSTGKYRRQYADKLEQEAVTC